jgi:predicted ATPase
MNIQRLEVNHFGPISEASVEIRPLLVLIGPQASGKSTMAKLIYFFQQLPLEFFTRFYHSEREYMDMTQDLIVPIREKFYDFFGSTFHLPDFTIVYHYSEGRALTLSLTPLKKLDAHFTDDFFTKQDKNALRSFKRELLKIKVEMSEDTNASRRLVLDERQLQYLHSLNDKINEIFCNDHNDQLFILAGRNATVGYSETFEDMLRESIQRNIEAQGRRAFDSKEQTVDETIMLSFMQRVVKMRQSFINLGNFEGMITHANKVLKPKLLLANKLIRRVLKGQYSNSEYGERIVHQGGNYVYLKNASSGQQESIRILQDAFLSLYQGNKLLRIVEEPEAHVYPEAQMATIQLLVLMLNNSPNNNLILTTHSPYTLTIINNLIYAAKVGEKHSEQIGSIVEKSLWLPSERVAAYRIINGRAENIIDDEIHEIKAELIDEISCVIGKQYDRMMDIEMTEGDEN